MVALAQASMLGCASGSTDSIEPGAQADSAPTSFDADGTPFDPLPAGIEVLDRLQLCDQGSSGWCHDFLVVSGTAPASTNLEDQISAHYESNGIELYVAPIGLADIPLGADERPPWPPEAVAIGKSYCEVRCE